jgi:hypothetical protein
LDGLALIGWTGADWLDWFCLGGLVLIVRMDLIGWYELVLIGLDLIGWSCFFYF